MTNNKEIVLQRIVLELHNDRDLFQSYMPFLKNGGLFVNAIEDYDLGANVMLEVTLPDALESHHIKGQVCWLTPKDAQNGTPPGIGISFSEDIDNFKSQIENSIGRLLGSSEPTLTM